MAAVAVNLSRLINRMLSKAKAQEVGTKKKHLRKMTEHSSQNECAGKEREEERTIINAFEGKLGLNIQQNVGRKFFFEVPLSFRELRRVGGGWRRS